VLRQNISPLEFLAVDFNYRRMRRLESLVDKTAWNIYIVSPAPGDASFEQLQDTLRRTHELTREPFESALPSRHACYVPMRGIRRGPSRLNKKEGGLTIEVHNEASFQFIYDRDDAIAHAFSNKILRILDKFLIHHFAVVNPETGEVLRESVSWAGPHLVEGCRQNPNRYVRYSGSDVDGVLLCIAPMSPEAYERRAIRKRAKP
jgi:hypothetical protein